MELNINDLAAVVQIIDVVTARGAFRGDELSQVGALRDKYAAFIKAAQESHEVKTSEGDVLSVDADAPLE